MELLRQCYSSHSSSSEDDEVVKNDSGQPDHKESKVDFFALSGDESTDDNEDTCADAVNNKDKTFQQPGPSSLIASGSFWNPGSSELIEWNKPDKVWVCSDTISNKDATKSKLCVASVRKQYKRHLPGNYDNSKNQMQFKKAKNAENHHTSQSRPYYFIHHKIASFLHQTVANRCSKSPISKSQEHIRPVNSISWCSKPDYSHLLVSASLDRTVKVWNAFAADGISCLRTLTSHNKGVKSVQWVGMENIVTASFDKTARIFDVEKGAELARFPHSDYVSAVEVHPINPNYFITGSKSSIQCWDKRVGDKCMRTFTYKDSFGQVEDIAIMENGTQFFSCNDNVTRDSADRNIMAWDFNKAVVLSNQIYQERFTCTKLCIHPDQSQFMAQTNGNYIALFSTIRPYKLNKFKRYEGHKVQGNKVGCDFSPDGKMILSGSEDGSIYFYDFFTAKLAKKIYVTSAPVLSVTMHPVLPSVVACGSADGDIVILQ